MLLESGKCCWSLTTLKGWIWYTTTIKVNNNKNLRQVWSLTVKIFITFNEKWLGRRESATDFPPRSHDLTPLDFYLWGTLKNTVYTTKPQTLEELRDKIQHEINNIPLATIQTVCRSVRRRCWECTVAEGGHFQHLRA